MNKNNISFDLASYSRSELKTGGVFEYVRHPIYGGLLLLCFGIAIISNSRLALELWCRQQVVVFCS